MADAAPTSQAFVRARRAVFCEDAEPCVDVTPEDVGLETPDRTYRSYREIVLYPSEKGEFQDAGGPLAWWRFEGDDDIVALDSSGHGFRAFKQGFESAQGVSGRGFLCRRGSVALGPASPSEAGFPARAGGSRELLAPAEGITVELWLKTDVAGQSDRWMVNCVGPPDTIAVGSFTVFFGGQPAARIGDMTTHGGTVTVGFPQVMIG